MYDGIFQDDSIRSDCVHYNTVFFPYAPKSRPHTTFFVQEIVFHMRLWYNRSDYGKESL